MRDVTRAAGWLAALLAVAACSGTSSGVGEGSGRLLVHDEAGTIFTVLPDGADRIDIVTPAATGTHRQPTWSPDGELIAYASATGGQGEIVVVDSDGEELGRATLDAPPFFISWSPGGDRLITLGSAADLGIEALLTEVGDELEVRRLDAGQPFYFVWDPGGGGILSHVGSGRLALQQLEGAPEPLDRTPARFQAPDWEGDRRLYALAEPADGVLVVDRGGETTELIRFAGPGFFDLAGDRVAFVARGGDEILNAAQTRVPQALPDALTVLDVTSRETTVVSREPVLAFEWSPDGSALLFLALGGDAALRWNVWTDEAAVAYPAFVATSLEIQQYLPFFDQYARSQTRWSPGSDAFAYAGTSEATGESGIWVQPVDGRAAPALVAGEGGHVSWSAGG